MIVAAMVVGIIGGVFGLLIGLFGYVLGGALSSVASDAIIYQIISMAIPVAGIVGASIVRHHTGYGGSLMAISGIGMLLLFGFNFFTMIPIILTGAGSALAFFALWQRTQQFSKASQSQHET